MAISVCPCEAADMSAVTPSSSTTSGSAPAPSSVCITVTLPAVAASISADPPCLCTLFHVGATLQKKRNQLHTHKRPKVWKKKKGGAEGAGGML